MHTIRGYNCVFMILIDAGVVRGSRSILVILIQVCYMCKIEYTLVSQK